MQAGWARLNICQRIQRYIHNLKEVQRYIQRYIYNRRTNRQQEVQGMRTK